MNAQLLPIKTIGLAKETESPENPGALEQRVALLPVEVKKLVRAGLQISVETGAGAGLGFNDDAYINAGAQIEEHQDIYRGKDMVIKFKGPSMEAVDWMEPGTILFCMAHFHSFPKRALKLEKRQINVVAMEHILESPKRNPEIRVLARVAMRDALEAMLDEDTLAGVDVRFIGWSQRMVEAIRRAGNREVNSLTILREDIARDELDTFGPRVLYFYDSKEWSDDNGIIPFVREKGCTAFDLHEYELNQGQAAVADWYASHPPAAFGLRRIQCLHETGQAGARYGFKLVTEISGRCKQARDAVSRLN